MVIDASQIQITHAVIHRVEKEMQDSNLSQTQLPLEENPSYQVYLGQLVVKALNDAQTKPSRFNLSGDTTARDLSNALLSDPRVFIEKSVDFAHGLGQAMRKSPGNVKGGNLIVCTYTDCSIEDNAKKPPTCLALIKIDPSQAYRLVARKHDGLKYLSLERVSDLMPTEEMNLQKAALILPPTQRQDFHLHLLDRQTRRVAARYFATEFLNVEVLKNENELTKAFYSGITSVYQALFLQAKPDALIKLTAEQADELLQHRDTALRTSQLVPQQWINNLGFLKTLPETQRQQVAEKLSLELTQRNIELEKELDIDASFAANLTQWKSLRGEGIHIKWAADKQKKIFPPDGKIPEPNKDGVIKLTVWIRDPK